MIIFYILFFITFMPYHDHLFILFLSHSRHIMTRDWSCPCHYESMFVPVLLMARIYMLNAGTTDGAMFTKWCNYLVLLKAPLYEHYWRCYCIWLWLNSAHFYASCHDDNLSVSWTLHFNFISFYFLTVLHMILIWNVTTWYNAQILHIMLFIRLYGVAVCQSYICDGAFHLCSKNFVIGGICYCLY